MRGIREARERLCDRLFFIGGFNQNAGFERVTPKKSRELVFDCFAANDTRRPPSQR